MDSANGGREERSSTSRGCMNPFGIGGQPSAITPPSAESNDDMGIREFLCIPRKHRRVRNEARSEAIPIEGRPVDLAGPPHSQSDTGIGSLISPEYVLPAPQNWEPGGT